MRSAHGVKTLFGYGIRVCVERGHLVLEDGIGERHRARFSRVGHGIRRLVVIGSDGMVSLSALRWLADQDAAFVMLERDGSVLATTGPVRPSDARLRRAQALASQSELALQIVQELIRRKLEGQERVARERLHNSETADVISQCRVALKDVRSILLIRQLEAQAAQAYWSAWRTIRVNYPHRDLRSIPDHWKVFGTRKSPLSGSPRLAVNPANAMLNYLYAVLESESRLALAALGLDPGIGLLHMDAPARDSLACDLMEAVRPHVDAYLLDWILREPLNRNWFFEQRDGNCRLMGSFAVRLSETATTWGNLVAPVAEWMSRKIWSTIRKPGRKIYPATRLTQNRKRQAKGSAPATPSDPAPPAQRICRGCGETLKRGTRYCASCSVAVSRSNLIKVAKLGRIATHNPKAEVLRAATQRRHAMALRVWKESGEVAGLTERNYVLTILPGLKNFTVPAIADALGVSQPYATDIRSGRRVPHSRHWKTLAKLVQLSTV